MNILIVEKNQLKYKEKVFKIDDLYTSDFLKYSNLNAKNFFNRSYYVNELFLSTFQPWMVLKYYIEKENIREIEFKSPNYILRALFSDLEEVCNVRIINKGISFHPFIYAIKAYFRLLISSLYLIFWIIKIPFREKQDYHPEKIFIIIRTAASEKKFRNFDFPKVFEDFKSKDSLHSLFPIFQRIFWIFQSFFTSITHLVKIKKNVRTKLGKHSFVIAYDFYGTRLVHTLLYERLLNAYFKLHKNEKVFTGNNLDRFSVVEEVLAKKYELEVICIPHGLEYGFLFPKGFSGDLFYTTTKHASDYFNEMYATSKFIFDTEIAKKMFTVDFPRKGGVSAIVFFTEPREVDVNLEILEKLIPLLEKESIRLALKLHPKDELKNYKSYDVDFIDKIEEALVDNICFARKSTTLLECIYNDSKAAAILINEKDGSLFYTFPSLQTEEIYVAKSINDLFLWIIKNINNKPYD